MLHIFRTFGGVLDNVLTSKEDTHQAGQHRADGVAHLHRNDLGTSLFLISEGIATVVLSPTGAGWGNIGVDITDRVGDVLRDDALQLVIVHRLLGCDVGAWDVNWEIVHVHIGTFFKITYMESTARGVRISSSWGNSRAAPYLLSLHSRCVIWNFVSFQPKYHDHSQ